MRCPYCNCKYTGHEAPDGNTNPKNGDISICVECGEVGEFKRYKIIKCDIDSLDMETKKEVGRMRIALLKTKAMLNAQKSEHHQG